MTELPARGSISVLLRRMLSATVSYMAPIWSAAVCLEVWGWVMAVMSRVLSVMCETMCGLITFDSACTVVWSPKRLSSD